MMVFSDSRVLLNASQPQHTDEGRFLGRMIYGGFFDQIIDRGAEYDAFPHNGGEHSFHLKMKKEDISSFTDIVEETFSSHPGCAGFISKIRSQL